MLRRTRGSLFAAALLAVPFAAPALAAEAPSTAVAEARELIDAQRPAEALAAVDRALAVDPDDAEALLVRSTARFMLGEVEAGREDLDRALVLDPELRQGWLNRGGLAVAEERYADALAAFQQAEQLDPRAPENDLNIGAVQLLQGDLEPASRRFERYLAGAGDSADGWYLVASNYALAGYAALAVEHLRGAVERDERSRRRSRTDPNFSGLSDNPSFLRLLATDSHRPPPGTLTAERIFDAPYDGGRGPLLPAVLDVLQLDDRPFDTQVEVTESWALIGGMVRIKVSDTLVGKGRVQLSAPPGTFGPEGWRQTVKGLLKQIQHRVLVRSLARERQEAEGRSGGRTPPRPPLP
jgi:tetratricopeptide (TPR) repeat protein